MTYAFCRASRAEITRLWLDRTVHVPDAAKRLGISVFQITHRAKLYGLGKRPGGSLPIALDEAMLADMWRAGVCLEAMALHFDVSPRTIRTRRKTLQLPNRTHNVARPQLSVAECRAAKSVQAMAADAAAEQRQMIVAEMADTTSGRHLVGWLKGKSA